MRVITLDIPGEQPFARVYVAERMHERMRGLLGPRWLNTGEAMLIPNCRAVHTIGMCYAIDCIFLDRAMRPVTIRRAVPPGRLFVWGGFTAHHVLEIPRD